VALKFWRRQLFVVCEIEVEYYKLELVKMNM